MLQISFDIFDHMGPTTGFVKGQVEVTHVSGGCRGQFTMDDQGVVVYEYDQNEVCEVLECTFKVVDTSDACCPPDFFLVTILPPPAVGAPCIETEEVDCTVRPQCPHCQPGTDVDCLLVPAFNLAYDQSTADPVVAEAASLVFSQTLDLNFTDVACRYTRFWPLPSTGGDARASLSYDANGISFEMRIRNAAREVIGRGEFYQDCANIECDRRYELNALPALANGTGSFNGLQNQTNWVGSLAAINPLQPLGTC